MPHLLFVVKLAWLLSHGLPVGFGAKVNAGGCNANAGTNVPQVEDHVLHASKLKDGRLKRLHLHRRCVEGDDASRLLSSAPRKEVTKVLTTSKDGCSQAHFEFERSELTRAAGVVR